MGFNPNGRLAAVLKRRSGVSRCRHIRERDERIQVDHHHPARRLHKAATVVGNGAPALQSSAMNARGLRWLERTTGVFVGALHPEE